MRIACCSLSVVEDEAVRQQVTPFGGCHREENVWHRSTQVLGELVLASANILHLLNLQQPVAFEGVLLRGGVLRRDLHLVGDADDGADGFGHADVVEQTVESKVSRIVQASTCELSEETVPNGRSASLGDPIQTLQANGDVRISKASQWIQPRPSGDLDPRRVKE